MPPIPFASSAAQEPGPYVLEVLGQPIQGAHSDRYKAILVSFPLPDMKQSPGTINILNLQLEKLASSNGTAIENLQDTAIPNPNLRAHVGLVDDMLDFALA